jgi:hypothetical protein
VGGLLFNQSAGIGSAVRQGRSVRLSPLTTLRSTIRRCNVADDDEFDAALNFAFLDAAERGDWDVLATHIEQGGKLTDAMRKFVARILRGERRSANRPPLCGDNPSTH